MQRRKHTYGLNGENNKGAKPTYYLYSLHKLFCIVVSEYTQGDAYLGSMIIEVLHLVHVLN